ncbi:heavy metal translocating P-type ATPase [Legionella worsleiensis]|uniref:Cation transport ATPase n=1 Tax=Legionella worsleiensis TaxID=45076 RepID=A0A0W1AJE4_9GAMM|nr:HAD-IC family P-type ATPase [Legionella worsleiensis]KTD81503.1 cation transport ATPase [Legionella worsleiensis]STY32062.1 cation transport ATPase [Legionella worsleiensis]
MYYYNFRFHLSDEMHDLETANIEGILNAAKELGVVRIAIDNSKTHKSLSVLSASKDQHLVHRQLSDLLLKEKIVLDELLESERFANTEEKKEKHHAHHSPVKQTKQTKTHSKKTKKTHHHNHNHNHNHSHSHSHSHHHDHDHHENHWLKASLGLIWGIGLLILSIASLNIPLIAYYVITGLTALMTLYLGWSVYQSAWNNLKKLNWDTATLYTISTLTIVGVSITSMFVPGLPMMFEAAPLVLGFWHLGEGIEHGLIDKINKKLDVRDCLNPLVQLKGQANKETSIKQLMPNDIIILDKNEIIPVDGIVTRKTLLYTTRINGSPKPRWFNPGDRVKAGMQLAESESSLELRVTKTFQNSFLSLIAKNVNKANQEKAPIELFANRVLYYFIPGLLGVALVSGLTIGLLFTPAIAIQCVISVLVSACPCALSLITPLAVKIGMNKTSEQGIHVKNGKTLQAAADIDTVVFDLNGTLTEGSIALESIHILDEELLGQIALLETQSPHPAAKVIAAYINEKYPGVSESLTLTSVDTSHHSGIKGIINGEQFIIGNNNMLKANNITQINAPFDNPENGSIYLVRGTTVIGQIALTDPLRSDALATVSQLKRLGKTVHLCTGADQATAERYAALLGIEKTNIAANTVGISTEPDKQSKTRYLEQLQAKGCKVAMVGDAANDLAAIASADIGIAVKSTIGDSITQNEAGIVLEQGTLFPIASAFDVAKKTKQTIFQNLFLSLAYNTGITLVAAGLFVAVGFALNPVLGVALMVIESTLILANLYRFKQQNSLTLASANKPVPKSNHVDNSTTHILNSLNHRSQPDLDLLKTHGSFSAPVHTSTVFTSETQKTSSKNLTDVDTALLSNSATQYA